MITNMLLAGLVFLSANRTELGVQVAWQISGDLRLTCAVDVQRLDGDEWVSVTPVPLEATASGSLLDTTAPAEGYPSYRIQMISTTAVSGQADLYVPVKEQK